MIEGEPVIAGGPGRIMAAVARQAGQRLVGLDVMEVTPCADPAGITAVLAAKVVREAILARTTG